MRVVVAGGFLGKPKTDQEALQPSPEAILVRELSGMKLDVRGIGLKNWSRFWRFGDSVLHVHHMSKMAVAGALLGRTLVFTHHSSVYARRGGRLIAEFIVWRRAACVVCLSATEEDEKLRLFPFLRGRTCVIPNGVEPVHVARRARNWIPRSEFVIAVVGQLIELKRVEVAIEAVANLPEYMVLELTFHNDSLEGELRAFARKLGVEDRVRFLGQASGDALAERYQRAHLLLLTSRTESLPSVVTEALISGLPVVASAVGAVHEQVGAAGICVNVEVGGYGEAVREIADEYARYADAAFVRGKELRLFSPAKMAEQHVELYRRVSGEGQLCT